MKRIALALALATAAAAPAYAQVTDGDAAFRATTLTLSSHGEARTAPDQASISLGVTTEATTAAEALRLNRERMNAVVTAVRAQGVLERDIQTSGLNLNPQYIHAERQAPRISGYQASNQVTLNVKDLSKLGPVIDAVVRVGANQINGINFGLQNVDAASDDARRTAIRNLQQKAELYAQASGHRIVRLVSLAESGGYTPVPYPRPMMRMAMAEAASVGSTPVQPGEVQVRVDVTAVYEMAR